MLVEPEVSMEKSFFNSPLVSRVRRNHALEHATIHVLSRQYPHLSFSGHSDSRGFWILGRIGTEEMANAVTEALVRLQNGESDLAIHDNCGTNYVTYGAAAGIASFLGFIGARSTRSKLERLPLVVVFASVALILVQPLGFKIQKRFSTDSKPGDLQIMDVIRSMRGSMIAHRITTRG